MSRPRPVLLYGIIGAAVSAFLSGASAVHLVPAQAVAVVALVWTVVGAGWAVYVQSVVTPVEDPRNADGAPLVTVEEALEAALPAGTTTDDRPVRDLPTL